MFSGTIILQTSVENSTVRIVNTKIVGFMIFESGDFQTYNSEFLIINTSTTGGFFKPRTYEIFNLADGLYKAHLYVEYLFGQIIKESSEFYVDISQPGVGAEVISIERIPEGDPYRAMLRVELEETLGTQISIYLNQSYVDSQVLVPGTRAMSINISRPGFYITRTTSTRRSG